MPLKKMPVTKKQALKKEKKKTHEEVVQEIKELQAKIDALNPKCARGGCLHSRLDHQLNPDGKYECHKCSCVDFME